MLAILQRDARLIDFLMEDISAYSDDQVGAAVRSLHDQSRTALSRYVTLAPVIDGVEHTPTRVDSRDPNSIKLLGNVRRTERSPRVFFATRAGASNASNSRESLPAPASRFWRPQKWKSSRAPCLTSSALILAQPIAPSLPCDATVEEAQVEQFQIFRS